jgi:hypothetical protein
MVQDCNGTAEGKKKPWIQNRWWLADREVQSPHSTAFFIAKPTAHESLADNYNEVRTKTCLFFGAINLYKPTLTEERKSPGQSFE